MTHRKKTAMQYCISVINEGIAGIKSKYNGVNIISIEDKARLDALESFKDVMTGQLPAERSQIEEAYDEGFYQGSQWPDSSCDFPASDYFTQTYGDE